MSEWNMSVQKMLDCVEENLTGPLTLEMLAQQLNYSSYYCTRQFHKYAGISLRDYIRLRKVSSAVLDLRDTGERIIEIAVKYGFSSQEAFTRSFKKVYGMTPGEYRKMPKPLPLRVKRNVFEPYYSGFLEAEMETDPSRNISISIVIIPSHKFIGVFHAGVDKYWAFWKEDEKKYGRDRCDEVDGVLSSIRNFNGIIGAWIMKPGKNGYMYGIEVPADYTGDIPEGMEVISVPESTYAVFHHPPYDYATMEPAVGEALRQTVENWNPAEHGYRWNNDLPHYQRHNPAGYGQADVKPLKKL